MNLFFNFLHNLEKYSQQPICHGQANLFYFAFLFYLFAFQTSNNDRSSHKAVLSALEVIGFSKEEITSVYQILATILLLVF